MEQLDETRQALLSAKLGRFNDWEVPKLVPTVGPCDPSPFHEFHVAVRDVVDACRGQLETYSDDEVRSLVEDIDQDPGGVRSQWEAFAADDLEALKRREPPWFAGGLGHPDHQADLAYWARMPHFTTLEITCLSVGIKPESFTKDQIERLAKGKAEVVSPVIRFLLSRYTQLTRHFGPDGRIAADTFTYWAIRYEFDLPAQFFDLLKRVHIITLGASETSDKPRKESKREIEKIAQLLVAMAVDGYGYDPTAKRSAIPKEITDAAAGIGIEIHPDTVRKYLKLGAEFVSPEWKPRKK